MNRNSGPKGVCIRSISLKKCRRTNKKIYAHFSVALTNEAILFLNSLVSTRVSVLSVGLGICETEIYLRVG